MDGHETNWEDMPADLLSLVAADEKLCITDVVCMAAVCKSWRASILRGHGQVINGIALRPSPIPRLLLSESPTSTIPMRGLFDLTSRRVVEINLPEAEGRRCCGSAYGWLITIGSDMEIHLLNPMSRTQLRLPSQLTFTDLVDGFTNEQLHAEESRGEICKKFIDRVTLTDSPGSNKCMVAALILPGSGICLAYTGVGEEHSSWTLDPSPAPEDILFYQGKLYGITVSGELLIFDFNDTSRGWQGVSRPSLILDCKYFKLVGDYRYYLAQVLDEMVAVIRFYKHIEEGRGYKTVSVSVFKFTEGKKWSKMDDLGNCCLFMGANTPLCLSPVPNGCRRNCIYFSDDHKEWYTSMNIEGGSDMGVYSMEDKTFSSFYEGVSTSLLSPPIWIQLSSFK